MRNGEILQNLLGSVISSIEVPSPLVVIVYEFAGLLVKRVTDFASTSIDFRFLLSAFLKLDSIDSFVASICFSIASIEEFKTESYKDNVLKTSLMNSIQK